MLKKLVLGLGVIVLFALLFAGALAFSLTLQNLRVNALSFAQPAEAAVIAAPMTSDQEAGIASPDTGSVRMEKVAPLHVCNKNKVQDRTTDF